MGPSEIAGSLEGRLLAGRYRLLEMIGSGGAGNVWSAMDEVLQRRVAVKDVGAPPWLSVESWQALRERTLREARAAAAISHPNVVTVYDVVEEDDRPWIVMQLVEARTLSQILDQEGLCPPRRVAEIGLQVLAALQAAHAHGILHRDVKPSNVLVCEDGRAVLTDFGIATVDGDVALTASGVLVGAPAYIAPERVQGGAAGPASDLWSLGATLYTAVEGRPPYRRDGAIDTIAAAVHEDPDPTVMAGPLAPLLAAMLDRDPEHRPSVAEVEHYLRGVASGAFPAGLRPTPTNVASDTSTTRLTPAHDVSETMPSRPTAIGAAALAGAAAGATASAPAAGAAEPQRLRRWALLAAAATMLVMIVSIGYLARHTLEPGSPQRPVNEQPANPEPIADVQGRSSVPGAGGAARAPSRGDSAPTPTTGTSPAETTVGTTPPTMPSHSPVDVTPTSTPQPTTADPTSTTTPEPTGSGQAGPPSVLP